MYFFLVDSNLYRYTWFHYRISMTGTLRGAREILILSDHLISPQPIVIHWVHAIWRSSPVFVSICYFKNQIPSITITTQSSTSLNNRLYGTMAIVDWIKSGAHNSRSEFSTQKSKLRFTDIVLFFFEIVFFCCVEVGTHTSVKWPFSHHLYRQYNMSIIIYTLMLFYEPKFTCLLRILKLHSTDYFLRMSFLWKPVRFLFIPAGVKFQYYDLWHFIQWRATLTHKELYFILFFCHIESK